MRHAVSVRIRAGDVRDVEPLRALLRRGGLLDESTAEADLSERAHRLARRIFVAEERAGDALGMMALFERSPSSLYGADFVVDPERADPFVTAVAIWRVVLDFAASHGFDWISTRPKRGSPRSQQFYRLMGVSDCGPQEMETPLPLCRRLWKDVGDDIPLMPTYDVGRSAFTFSARATIIEVDRTTGTAVCRNKTMGNELQRREGRRLSCVVNGDEPLTSAPSGPTSLRLAPGISLLPPLWSYIPTHGIRLPILDQWAWEVAALDAMTIELVQSVDTAPSQPTGRATARRRHQALQVTLRSNRPYLRLLFECDPGVSIVDSELRVDGVMVRCHPTPSSTDIFPWNDATRVAFHCGGAGVSVETQRTRSRLEVASS
jgi:hypothetical protein